MRTDAIADIAERILQTAQASHDAAPKLILDESEVSPPAIEWHCSYTAAQFIEVLMRLLVMRKIQVTELGNVVKSAGLTDSVRVPKGFNDIVGRCVGEANRVMKVLGIELAQEL